MRTRTLGWMTAGLLCAAGWMPHAHAEVNLVLLANGAGEPNTYPADRLPASFTAWCAGCFPTVKLALVDAKTQVPQGHLYAWGQNVVANPPGPIGPGSTFCFDEFVIWQLPGGEVHTVSTRGPCGTYLDKALVPPVDNPGATVVAGGGQGTIVGGTRGYQHWTGTYATRVFVEDLSVLQFSYYDFLFATLSGTSRPPR